MITEVIQIQTFIKNLNEEVQGHVVIKALGVCRQNSRERVKQKKELLIMELTPRFHYQVQAQHWEQTLRHNFTSPTNVTI